jgi:HlyD family secretion protein
MEERATSRPDIVSVARIKSSLGFWLAIAVALSCFLVNRAVSNPQSETPGTSRQTSVAPGSLGDVHALARLEPASGLIVAGARPGARIERIQVGQGDNVTPGQVLAILEGHDQAQGQLALVEAQKTRAIHQRSVQKQKLALEREQFDKLQKAKLDAATRVAFITNQRFDESTKLYKTLGAGLQGRDRLEADMRYFESEVQNIKAKLDKESLEIAQDSVPRQRKLEDDELGDKSPDLDVLDRQIDLARVSLAQTEARAPIGGRIIELMAHAGEVSSGPLLAMGELSAMVATAEVYQSDVPRLRPGDPASVQILDQAVTGKVARIGSVVGKNQLTNLDPRALQDRRVVKVTISLDDPTLAARFVNMEVEVAIKPGAGTRADASPGTSGQ